MSGQFIAKKPESIVQKLEWDTGILKSHSGKEQRIAYRQVPREQWAMDVPIDPELDRRDFRLAFFTDPVSAWSFPRRYERAPIDGVVPFSYLHVKTSGGTAWNAGGSSTTAYLGPIRVEFTVPDTAHLVFVGLSNTDPDADYATIKYGFYAQSNAVTVYESGVLRYTGLAGSIVAGDVLAVERVGTTITYLVNGVVQYTSGASDATALRVDTSLWDAAQCTIELWVDDVNTRIVWQNLVRSTATETPASIMVDATLLDWAGVSAAGQEIYVEGYDPDDAFLATVESTAGMTATRVLRLSAGPPLALIDRPAYAFPVQSVLLDDGQAFGREGQRGSTAEGEEDVGAGVWRMAGIAETARSSWGAGASLTSHDGIYVCELDLETPNLVEERFIAGSTRHDYGGPVQQEWHRSYADVQRSHAALASGAAGRQYLYLFLLTICGQQTAFLLPTWQPDLDLVSQPAGGTTIDVYKRPGFASWFASGAHKHLQLEKDDGSVEYAKATGVVDNGDGTETITVSATIGAGTVAAISLLELVRLVSDEVSLEHRGDRTEFELRAIVVQQ